MCLVSMCHMCVRKVLESCGKVDLPSRESSPNAHYSTPVHGAGDSMKSALKWTMEKAPR